MRLVLRCLVGNLIFDSLMNAHQKKWKYFVSFSCRDPGSSLEDLKIDDIINFFYILYNSNFDRILTEDSFPKLLLMMAITGIDANEVNFNKVSMLNDVEKR